MASSSNKARFLWLVLALASVSGRVLQDEAGSVSAGSSTSNQMTADNVCHVCGEGGEIDNPSRMIMTSLGMFTCGGLAGAGQHGNIAESQCTTAQTVAIEKCGCLLDDGTTLNQGDNVGSVCRICPDDGLVTIPGGIVSVPGAPQRTCSYYMESALAGMLEPDQCEEIQNYTNETCGCMDESEVENLNRPGPSNDTYVCPVCGEGMRSSKPTAAVSIPGQSVRTCAQFEQAASMGKISEQQCGMVRSFVQESCACDFGAPVAPPPTLAPDAYDCPVCGEGNVITIPDGVVHIPTQPNRTCAELLHANSIGNIKAGQCALLQPFVTTPCGCMRKEDTKIPSVMPSDAPSLAPTMPTVPTISPAPTGWETQKVGCFDNLMEIVDIEKRITDPTSRRKYILCPDTTFNLGHLTEEGRINAGDAFLMLRPNVMYQCGEDGSRLNNCILKGGDFGLTSFYGVYDGIYETANNVRIQGLTFQSQMLFSVVLEAAGDIEFIDCVFKGHGSMAPILIQWRGDGPKQPIEKSRNRKLRSSAGSLDFQLFKQRMTNNQSSELEAQAARRKLQQVETEFNHAVTFRNCVFRDNYVTEEMGFPGIIENSFGSELNIVNCLFQDNSYGSSANPAHFGYAVRSYGPVHVESSCFMDNTFQTHGPIQVFGAAHTSMNNYVRSYQKDLTCNFLAVFASQDDTTDAKPVCFDSDATSCPFSQPPTMAPTQSSPTESPVNPPKEESKSVEPPNEGSK